MWLMMATRYFFLISASTISNSIKLKVSRFLSFWHKSDYCKLFSLCIFYSGYFQFLVETLFYLLTPSLFCLTSVLTSKKRLKFFFFLVVLAYKIAFKLYTVIKKIQKIWFLAYKFAWFEFIYYLIKFYC